MKEVFKEIGLHSSQRVPRLIEFTLVQLLQHNIQLGAHIKFSLFSSQWFIFGVRNKFTIVHLSQTVIHYRVFLEIISYTSYARRRILFVNERRFTSLVVADVALSVGETYVMGRWVGGTLTNFRKIWFMYHYKLKNLNTSLMSNFKLTLRNSLVGISGLRSLPSVIFFNSTKHSKWATWESYALLIPACGITDTDASPYSIFFPIPGNDDAFGSIHFLNQLVAKAALISKIIAMLKIYNKFYNKSREHFGYYLNRSVKRVKRKLWKLMNRKFYKYFKHSKFYKLNKPSKYNKFSKRKSNNFLQRKIFTRKGKVNNNFNRNVWA